MTIGFATVNYSALSNLKEADALREMTMGRTVLESTFEREVRHFAYPFGDKASFQRAHVVLAEEAGFHSAVSTIPGIVDTARFGMGNQGHTFGDMLNDTQRAGVIEFLKTL